ncbi:hypothetical protein K090096B2_20900 [Bacteroides fragilis]
MEAVTGASIDVVRESASLEHAANNAAVPSIKSNFTFFILLKFKINIGFIIVATIHYYM